MHTLTVQQIRSYIAHRRETVRAATVNRELALLSAAINTCNHEFGWQLPNPVAGRRLKEPEGRARWLSPEEADHLIETARSEPKAPHLADFLILALHTGCRSGELLGLEWTRVDLPNRLLYLEGQHTKSGKRRSIPLNQKAYDALIRRARLRSTECPESRWVFCDETGRRIRSVKRSFATACRRTHIADLCTHDLRHTCAAWLVSAGVPLTTVRDLLGHHSIIMTERYAHLAPEHVRNAVAVLESPSRSGHAQQRPPKTVS